MASGAPLNPYEAAAFILVSDSESNGVFGNESTLESSDSYDSEIRTLFPWYGS